MWCIYSSHCMCRSRQCSGNPRYDRPVFHRRVRHHHIAVLLASTSEGSAPHMTFWLVDHRVLLMEDGGWRIASFRPQNTRSRRGQFRVVQQLNFRIILHHTVNPSPSVPGRFISTLIALGLQDHWLSPRHSTSLIALKAFPPPAPTLSFNLWISTT